MRYNWGVPRPESFTMATATSTPSPAAQAPPAAPVTPPPALPVSAPSPVPATYRADPSVYRFSVAQYQQMVEAGVLTVNDKVELLEGYVVLKMARNPPHDG